MSEALQFGHDLSAVETIKELLEQTAHKGFNSATTFQPWKHVFESLYNHRK